MRRNTFIENYSGIFFSCLANEETMYCQIDNSHALKYIISGKMSIFLGHQEIYTASAGEIVFVRNDHRISYVKRPTDGLPYKGVQLSMERNFLRYYLKNLDSKFVPKNSVPIDSIIKKLPTSPDIRSIFTSMRPFIDTTSKPIDEVMKLRLEEAILILLKNDDCFYSTLFDFTDPWKIDILDFLNKNYMNELSIEEIASCTGRSLATFKRDFKKISELPPQKWIVKKRLEVAHEKLANENKTIAEVYTDVGFKNRSHFAALFKQYYGYSPASVVK